MFKTATLITTASLASAVKIHNNNHNKSEMVDMDIGNWIERIFGGWSQNKADSKMLYGYVWISELLGGWVQSQAKIKGEDWVDTAVDVGEWAWDN